MGHRSASWRFPCESHHIKRLIRRPSISSMTAVTLILVAPCSLLLGAVLQILVAKLCSARTKGILAALSCLPAVLAVAATVRLVQAVQAFDVKVLHWNGPLPPSLHL